MHQLMLPPRLLYCALHSLFQFHIDHRLHPKIINTGLDLLELFEHNTWVRNFLRHSVFSLTVFTYWVNKWCWLIDAYMILRHTNFLFYSNLFYSTCSLHCCHFTARVYIIRQRVEFSALSTSTVRCSLGYQLLLSFPRHVASDPSRVGRPAAICRSLETGRRHTSYADRQAIQN